MPSLFVHTMHTSIGQNGKGLIRWIAIFICDDHYRPTNRTWARDLCASCGFFGCLMTQIASVLAVAVFLSL